MLLGKLWRSERSLGATLRFDELYDALSLEACFQEALSRSDLPYSREEFFHRLAIWLSTEPQVASYTSPFAHRMFEFAFNRRRSQTHAFN